MKDRPLDLEEHVKQHVANMVGEKVTVKVQTRNTFPYGKIDFLFIDKQTSKKFLASISGSEIHAKGLQVLDELAYHSLKQLGFEEPSSS